MVKYDKNVQLELTEANLDWGGGTGVQLLLVVYSTQGVDLTSIYPHDQYNWSYKWSSKGYSIYIPKSV